MAHSRRCDSLRGESLSSQFQWGFMACTSDLCGNSPGLLSIPCGLATVELFGGKERDSVGEKVTVRAWIASAMPAFRPQFLPLPRRPDDGVGLME